MALTDSLAAYWALNEASGSRSDSVGSETLSDNNSTGSTTGIISTAASFVTANSTFLDRASDATLQTGDIDFTVQAWVKLTDKATVYSFVSKRDQNASGKGEYLLWYNSFVDRFQFIVYNNDEADQLSVDADNLGSPTAGIWYLVHGWHDSVNNLIGIAVNAGTADTSSYAAGVAASASAFSIGAKETSFNHDCMNGAIDEVGFWKRILTSGDRTQLYNGGAGLAYPFSAGGPDYVPFIVSPTTNLGQIFWIVTPSPGP